MRQLSLFEAFSIERPQLAPPPPPPPSRRAASPTPTENGTVCYICYEPTAETSQCHCKSVVHADCLLKSIRISKRPHCTICHGPIANLSVRQRRRFYVPLTILMYLSGVFVGIAGVSAMLLVAEAAEEQDMENFYRLLIRSIGCVMEAIAASKLFAWLVERRDLEMVHAEFEYEVGGDSLASAGRLFERMRTVTRRVTRHEQ